MYMKCMWWIYTQCLSRDIATGSTCSLLYSGLFPWGANFSYFCGNQIYYPQNFPPSLQHCIHILKFGTVTFVMVLICYLRPIDSALDQQDPLSQAVPRVVSHKTQCWSAPSFLVETRIRTTCPKFKVHMNAATTYIYGHIKLLVVAATIYIGSRKVLGESPSHVIMT